MGLVMRNNLFEWGDLYFLQLTGTAMGTSAACMWATIYFAINEMTTLIPGYNQSLIILKLFINDIFGIWICDDPDKWLCFKKDVNNFGILTWELNELSTSVNFLDLNINIDRNRITS